jgi:hypothetical protein
MVPALVAVARERRGSVFSIREISEEGGRSARLLQTAGRTTQLVFAEDEGLRHSGNLFPSRVDQAAHNSVRTRDRRVVSRGCLYFPGSRVRVWSRGTQAVSGGLGRGHRNDACRSLPRGRVCRGGRRGAPRGLSAINAVMSSSVVPRVVSVIVVAVISRRWWRCDKACHRPHSSADSGAEGRTVTAGSGSPDCSPAACADEAASNCPLDGIVWISAGR